MPARRRAGRRRTAVAATTVLLLAAAAPAEGAAPRLTGPALRAAGIAIALTVRDAPAGAPVDLQRLVGGRRWLTVGRAVAAADGTARLRYRPLVPHPRLRLRAVAGGLASPALTVRSRPVTLAAFGDANLGDGVGAVMDRRGALWPWAGVAPTLRRADIAFGNLECSISDRGSPVAKQFSFRGSPGRLARIVPFAGLDVLNLANNHVGDYGTTALLDTLRAVRRAGALPVGAGATLAAARRPQVVSRLGLRVAFVGFSDIGPASFAATPSRPGTSFASPAAIAAAVRAARRAGDVVIATFHWGVERRSRESARQRLLARTALAAGATAVIGAHPHVLQPLRRAGIARRRLVAYSLGNFVWAAGSAAASATGILRMQLSGRGVEGAILLPARIAGTRPRLLGRAR